MNSFQKPHHIPGFTDNRFTIRFLLILLCFSTIYLYGYPVTKGATASVDQPGLIPSITGPDSVCYGTGGYIYTTDPGMAYYTWTLSSGGTITSGAGTNSIVVAWSQAGTEVVMVNYATATAPGTLHVTVLPLVVPAITISPDNNPVCEGTPVLLSAAVVNGGTTPVLQWMVNGYPVGTNSSVFSYIPSNGDVVTCDLYSTAQCNTLPQVVSNPVSMIVSPLRQTGVFISVSSNPVCQGTQVTFTAVSQNGGPAPVYQWKVNGLPGGGNSPVFSMTPVNGDLVVCEMTSSATCVIGNPASSSPIVMTVSPSQLVSISVSASANPVCQGTSVTYTALPANGGTSPQFSWRVNNIVVSSAANSFTYVPFNGDAVTCKLTSSASCTLGNPAVSAPVTMITNQVVPVSVSIQASANPVCQGITTTFTAFPVNGGTSPVYQWMLNGFPVGTNSAVYNYAPANGDVIFCKLFSSVLCQSVSPALSNSVTMTVTPNIPVSVSISASSNPVCVASSVTLTATAFNGGTAPTFEWKVNGVTVVTNSASYTFFPNHGDQVVCWMTSNIQCAPVTPVSSNVVTMAVSQQLPVSVSIVTSLNPVCQNVQVVFTATPVNGGTSPNFQWKVNGMNSGSNNQVFTYIPQDGDQVTCTLTSSSSCATGNPAVSNIIAMTVIPSLGIPVSSSIMPSTNPSCTGLPVTYTAQAVNGGSTPAYAWTVNGLSVGTNSPTFSYIPSNGDFIRCWVTSDLTCATNNPAGSNEISMTVNPILPVSVTITTAANPSCLAAMVTYTAVAVNAGLSPVYQWKVDGVNAGTNQNTFVYSPVNGNVITCQVTSSLQCCSGNPATSNAINMTVMPVLPVTISISTLTNPSCTASQVTFTATISNGGTAPVYQWKLNGNNTGSNNATLIFTPATGNVVTCRLTSNALCYSGSKIVTSSPITMVVKPELAPAVSISTSTNPFCEGSPVTFTATPTNGGTLPVYQWRVNCLPVGTTSSTYTYVPTHGDFVTGQMTSNLTCAVMNPCKSNGITMLHHTETPASIRISASNSLVCPGSSVTFASAVVNGGTSPVYQWKVNGISSGSNSPGFTYSPSNGDVVTCQLTSNAACVSGSPAVSNPLSMGVSPALPAAIVINTPTNPFCPGNPVSFSAIPTNGGPAPVYQWKVNNLAAGTNAANFSYFALPGDVVKCDLLSNASCISGTNPITSNEVILQQASPIPVTISVNASANSVCAGTSVTFTATHSGGGDNPFFAWYVNGAPSGENSPVYTYAPGNGDIVHCIMSSNLSCAATPTAVSNNVIMGVSPNLPVAVTIIASTNPCCVGSLVTLTATVQNGGPAPVFQWVVNCNNVGTNSPEYSFVPVNGDVVVCHVFSNASCATGNPAVSNNINMVVLPIQPVSVAIVASFNPVCIGSPVTFTATPTYGGDTPGYQWQVNQSNIGTNSSTFTYPPADGDIVTCILNSNAVCTSGNPAVSNQIVMNGITALPVTISITASNNPICYTTLVLFTATTTNGGNSPVYQWKVNGINVGSNHRTYQYAPAIGDVVACQITTSLICATPNPALSDPIAMTVYPQAPVSVALTVSENPTCLGTPVTFNAAVTNGGTSPYYRYRVNGILVGTNNPAYSYTPVNGDVVYCRVTSNANCTTGNPANSNQIIMSVSSNTPASVTIAPSANPVCEGATVVYTATPFNGGSAPVYHWKVNGVDTGTSSAVFSYTPLNGDVVSCEMTSNSTCTTMLNAISNTVTMTVSAIQTVSLSVLPSVNPVCINSFVTYTAVPVNGGPSPQYQWKVNGAVVGTNNQTYTYKPADGDVVTCKLTSGLSCTVGSPVTSVPVVMSVYSSLPVEVTVVPTANPSCQGESVGFTALPVNGGYNPVYQWMVNGINVGNDTSFYSYMPAHGDNVTCRLTSDFSCATANPAVSAPLVMEVNANMPTAVSIVSSGNPACVGSTVTYTALPVNGGISPVYQWKVNGAPAGGNSPYFSYIPIHGDTVICQMASGMLCPANSPATSNPIIMNVVEPVPTAVSVSVSQNPACQGSQVFFMASPENGGYNPSFQWKVNGIHVGNGQATWAYAPSNGDMVVCEMTSSATCVLTNTAQSIPITMTVSSEFPVNITIQASNNPACYGQPVNYSAAIVNGGNSPTYQWMVNELNVGINNPVFTFVPSEGDIIKCLLTSDFSCATGNPATSNAIIMTVTLPIPAGIIIVPSANPVCFGNPVTYTASVTNVGLTPVFQWKVNGNNVGENQATFTYMPVNGDIITCLLTPNNPCSSSVPVLSNQVVMVVSFDMPVNVTISPSANNLCAGTPVTFTAIPENGGSAPVYQWMVDGNTVGNNSPTYTCIPKDGDSVSCILTSGLSCTTGSPVTSNLIAMVVYPLRPVSVDIFPSPPGAVCEGTIVNMIAVPENGGTNPFYQWFKNGLAVGSNQPTYSYIPTHGDRVFVEINSNLICAVGSPAVSDTLTQMVDDPLPVSVSVAADQNNICDGTVVTFTATPVNGGVPTYQWFLNGLPVGLNQPDYTYLPANGDVVHVSMITTLPCVTTQTASSNAINMIVNPLLPVSVTIVDDPVPVCQGSPVTLTATPINGGIPVYQWFLNGSSVELNLPVFTYVPNNGDQVYVKITSNLACLQNSTANSDMITITVNQPLTIDVGIDVNLNPVCHGKEVVFTATPVNGGIPVYQWYKNGLPVGAGLPVYSCIPEEGDRVYVEMKTGLTCVNVPSVFSDTIGMTVDVPLVVEAAIMADQNEVCEGTSVTFTALTSNGGVPVFQWYKNNIPVGGNDSLYSCIPLPGDGIHVEMTTSLPCVSATAVTSNQIFPVVNLFPGEASSISGPTFVCAGSTSVPYSILSVDMATSYTWNLPAGVTIATGVNERSIALDFAASSTSGVISVYGNNACGRGPMSPSMQVEVFPVPETPVIARDYNTLTSSAAIGNQWYFEGALLTDSVGQTLSPVEAGWYWNIVTLKGCSSEPSEHFYFDGKFPGPITFKPGFWVYPIPNDGHFTVAISLPVEDIFDISVYDGLGIQLFKISDIVVKSKFKRVIDLRPKLPKGLYYVVFKCADYQVVKKVLIYNR